MRGSRVCAGEEGDLPQEVGGGRGAFCARAEKPERKDGRSGK